jgi:hypothetical protein
MAAVSCQEVFPVVQMKMLLPIGNKVGLQDKISMLGIQT